MDRLRWGLLPLSLLLGLTPAQAAAGPERIVPPKPLAPPPDLEPARRALTAAIDQHLAATWARKGVTPAPLADDAEFLRRASLDLTGRIPYVAEVRSFMADTRSDKRERLIEKLLHSAGYANHLSSVWRAQLIPNADQNRQFFNQPVENWLRVRMAENTPWDEMARTILTAPIAGNQGFNFNDPQPSGFYFVNELKPENLAAATTRVFLGVKLECAQCHDHPFAPYTRGQFWETAAFFSGIRPAQPNNPFNAAPEDTSKHEIAIPGVTPVRKVSAKFLDGTEPKWDDKVNPRQKLSDWVTAPENPYFARNGANRLWALCFGIGLQDPVDEPRADNPPSHPELLDELARAFVAQKFDMKFMLKSIMLSRAYQATSKQTHSSQAEPRVFGRMPVRGLAPEQLFDSLVMATGYREPNRGQQRGFGPAGSQPRQEFLARFASVDRPTEAQKSILQALTLMNGKFIDDQTSIERSEALAAIVDAPFLDLPHKIEALYLATVSRPPTADETRRLTAYVEGPSGGKPREGRQALADIFWVLLNSSEFHTNH